MLFHVLGPVEAHGADGVPLALPAGKPTAVLATLLLNANRWVRVEQLVAATWHEQAIPSSAVANLKTYVWQLRRVLPETVDAPRLGSRPGAYRLRVDPGELDVDRAEGLAADARDALTDGHLAKAVELFTEALGLWRGEPCDGVTVDEWAGTLAWLAELRRELQEGLAEAYVRLGRTREAIALLRALTDEDPFREGSWARWMLALSDAGRHGAALAVYDRVRAILADELNAEPGRELRDALAAVHRYQRARRPSRRRDLVRDVPDFTGRAAEVDRLCALGAAGGVPVAVIDGMPGVGKTALAVHVAHRLAPSYPDAQLQVDLGAAEPAVVLDRLLRAIGVADADIPPDAPGRAALWRAELAHRRVLVLLDDARDTDQVLPLLPGSPGSLVLVTTRTRTLRLGGVCALTLEPMPVAAASALFRTMTADHRQSHRLSHRVDEVVELCGGLPAALRTAADVLRGRPLWTVRQLAARLPDFAGDLIGPAIRALPAGPRRTLSALATLPNAADATTVATTAGCTPSQARRALEDLLDHHLATQSGPHRYGLHPVVRAALTARVPRSNTASPAFTRTEFRLCADRDMHSSATRYA